MPEEEKVEMRKASFKAGDSVSYKVGRGRGTGTILDFWQGDYAIIQTAKGKTVKRKVAELTRS